MNVKNGIASSVSFDITPQIRSGSAPNSDGCSRPELDADAARTRCRWRASANATG